jgi:hypothetical protein
MNRFFLILMFAAAACTRAAGEPGAAASASPAASAPGVGPANDAVPAAWKSKLSFAALEIPLSASSKVTVPIPNGWRERSESWASGHYQPSQPRSSDWDGSTDFFVSSNCDGACEPKPAAAWATAADRGFAMGFPPALSPKTIKDEKVEGRRTVIASMVGHTTIMTAWWKEGADRYYYCAAVLPDKDSELVPAFEKACLAAQVH